MKVLHFAFGEDENNGYLPPIGTGETVLYIREPTTTRLQRGWLEGLDEKTLAFVRAYTACEDRPVDECVGSDPRSHFQRGRLGRDPHEDYLCLGNEARMNTPSTLGNNWKWRMKKDDITPGLLKNPRHVKALRTGLGAKEYEKTASVSERI